ncbi:MAG: glutamyl-tRNA reductase [Acidobacteria bacterium RIFCSPLOWO2_12_FULL_67_14b]|nr:MAG: glutamyl-tRNA reductase [Acidobacteria bacterium RIFCSPLOWO2_12_FULL_67_14b]
MRVLSISHRTHGMDGLAALAATPSAAAALHASMTSHGIESVMLTTCNRVELYWRSRTPQDDLVATGSLAAAIDAGAEGLVRQSSWLAGDAAAHHLFRVCAGLESVVIGEAEVLGQARAALEASHGAGRFVTGVFQAAIRAGGAARAETGIGHGAMSVASTAVQWLAAHVSLASCRVLIVGAGDTARKAARHLNAINVGSMVVANRTVDRAQALARGLGAEAVGLDALQDEILRADAIVSAVNVSECVITRDHLHARCARADRPLFVVDLSMPPSVELTESVGIRRIDLGVIELATRANREQRAAEAPRVEVVIERELAWLRRWAAREGLRQARSRRCDHETTRGVGAES